MCVLGTRSRPSVRTAWRSSASPRCARTQRKVRAFLANRAGKTFRNPKNLGMPLEC